MPNLLLHIKRFIHVHSVRLTYATIFLLLGAAFAYHANEYYLTFDYAIVAFLLLCIFCAIITPIIVPTRETRRLYDQTVVALFLMSLATYPLVIIQPAMVFGSGVVVLLLVGSVCAVGWRYSIGTFNPRVIRMLGTFMFGLFAAFGSSHIPVWWGFTYELDIMVQTINYTAPYAMVAHWCISLALNYFFSER